MLLAGIIPFLILPFIAWRGMTIRKNIQADFFCSIRKIGYDPNRAAHEKSRTRFVCCRCRADRRPPVISFTDEYLILDFDFRNRYEVQTRGKALRIFGSTCCSIFSGGGVLAFGFVGVFIGPTLLAVGYSLVQEWASSDGPG
ncbi:MAG TPA: hypothetical protein VIM35_08705 [Gallionella sp.]